MPKLQFLEWPLEGGSKSKSITHSYVMNDIPVSCTLPALTSCAVIVSASVPIVVLVCVCVCISTLATFLSLT